VLGNIFRYWSESIINCVLRLNPDDNVGEYDAKAIFVSRFCPNIQAGKTWDEMVDLKCCGGMKIINFLTSGEL
jgi:hypothetical protein